MNGQNEQNEQNEQTRASVTRASVDAYLRERPDLAKVSTSETGDYTTYVFQDGSRIDIRNEDGRVTRTPAPRYQDYNPDGTPKKGSPNINKGYRYRLGEGEIKSIDANGNRIPGAHDSNEYVIP